MGEVIGLRPSSEDSSESKDDTLERLTAMTNLTCLVALDKTIQHLEKARTSGKRAGRAAAIASIGERIVRASKEVRLCLPKNVRLY